jgi:ArsR family transcriptional regulator
MDRSIPAFRTRGERCCEGGPDAALGSDDASSLAESFRLLSDPVRLQILDVLSHHEGRVCVCDLEAAVSVKQPTVSHHLGILRRAGLVESERRGVWAYYFLNRERLAEMRRAVVGFLEPVGGREHAPPPCRVDCDGYPGDGIVVASGTKPGADGKP